MIEAMTEAELYAPVEWHDCSAGYEDILYHKSPEGIAKITINRPQVRNAFRPRTVKEMLQALADARYDDKVGSILLELIFVAESAAHPQLYRFMPPTPIRLLMDKNGQNLGEKVAFDAFNRQLTPVNRHLGSKLVTASQPVIHGLIGKGEVIANELKAGIVDKARAQMAQTLQQDLDRLEALKAGNPNVRDSELDYLRNLQAELHHLIDQTQLKLDAIRFIVVTHN